MELQELNAGLFRQRLAGLADESAMADELDFSELASDFVLLLAIAFNRRELKATSLWDRIEAAIKKAGAEVDHDVQRFVSIALEFVKAPVNVVVSVPDALTIQGELYALSDEDQVVFMRYVQTHLYPAIVFGRAKWNDRKARLQTTITESEVSDAETN